MGTAGQASTANAVLSDEELAGELRSLKKWTLATYILIPAAFTVPFALLWILFLNEMFAAGIVSGAGGFVLALTIGVYASKRGAKLKELMGNTLTLPMLCEIFEVKEYSPLKYISADLVKAAGLIDDWERISGSDFFEGKYNGINVMYSDLQLERLEIERDKNGKEQRRYVTVFKGQWLVCDFGKELAASVRLTPRKGGTKRFRKYDVSKSDVETENAAFNKKYRIITYDGHTAFYLLTPHFMEQLAAADEAADASTLFCFKDGKVHIALYSGRDSFELNGVKIDSVDNVRRKFRRELKYMTDIIDELLRNDRLFKQV